MRKYLYPAMILMLIITLLLLLERCQFIKQNATENSIALTDTVTYYTNRLGTQTASIKTLQLQQQELKDIILAKDKQLTALAKEFSHVKSVVQYEQVTILDTIAIVYRDTVRCVFSNSGNITSKWYNLNYKSNNKGFTIDSLTLPNHATIITGYKRKWFLGRETLTTDVTNSNPYITVTNLRAINVVVPTPWYKKWYGWLGAGIAGGFLLK